MTPVSICIQTIERNSRDGRFCDRATLITVASGKRSRTFKLARDRYEGRLYSGEWDVDGLPEGVLIFNGFDGDLQPRDFDRKMERLATLPRGWHPARLSAHEWLDLLSRL